MSDWTAMAAGNGPTNALEAAQQEIQAQYTRSGKAYKNKDVTTLMQMVTPDFTQRMPDGQMIYKEQVETALAQWFETILAVTDYLVVIDDLTLLGQDVVALVSENVSTNFLDPTGKKHQALQANTSRVTWTLTRTGWRIRQTEYLTGRMLIDGLPVN